MVGIKVCNRTHVQVHYSVKSYWSVNEIWFHIFNDSSEFDGWPGQLVKETLIIHLMAL